MEYLFSPTKGKVTIDEAYADIIETLKDSGKDVELIVGSGSQQQETQLKLVTAIAVRIDGRDGYYFLRYRKRPLQNAPETKINTETLESMTTADQLKDELRKRLNNNKQYPVLRIHVDVGRRGNNRKLVSEIEGWLSAIEYPSEKYPKCPYLCYRLSLSHNFQQKQ